MIGTLPGDVKIHRQEHMSTLVHAYNCTRSNTTEFSPYFLLHGRHPMLLIDIEFGVETPDLTASTTSTYVGKLYTSLEWACKTVQKVKQKECEHSKSDMITISL